MSRQVDTSKPLSKGDLEYLKERFPLEYVQSLVDSVGVKGKKEKSSDSLETAEPGDGDGNPSDSPVGEGEDLLGTVGEAFEPGDHTEAEIRDHLESASDEEKARVLQAEADGKARKGVLAL